jgi:Cu(I)/Ag(I) efflux system membrane protein CusA/SilA
MIDAIIEWSARNKLVVLVVTGIAVVLGIHSIRSISLDAIPDLSDPQVIVYTEWPGRSPDLVEDQITYPVVSALLAAPGVSVVRGASDYGFSYVYVIFEEGTDLYWGRTRVLEYMDRIRSTLPEGVSPTLGPDATGVGWAFEYALVDRSGRHDLAQLRSFNDWYVRYWLASVPGVAEVATIGGFVKQYQIHVDPNRLLAFGIPLGDVIDVVRRSNRDVGGRVVEFTGKEYLVRGKGYLRSVEDIEGLPVGTDSKGTPILIRNVAQVQVGADMRRGVSELNGEGEVTGGIVVARHGQNALEVIEGVKAKLEEVKPGFPPGVELVTTYDRSELILRSISTLLRTLAEELLIVSLVILVFLRHLPSAVIPIVTIPIAVIIGFVPMYASGLSSNIMSLAGIAIAIGALVDAAIVVVEQTHKKLEQWEAGGRRGDHRRVIIDAVKEVGGPSFFALLVIAVAFLPIFALQAQEGRLFKPLAFTKNTAMAVAAVLAITFDPVLRLLLTRVEPFRFRPRWLSSLTTRVVVGRIEPEEGTWLSRALMAVYQPALLFTLRHRAATLLTSVLLLALTVPAYLRLGSEFMPPLNEGSLLYMPITLPGISVTEATKYLQLQDKLLATFPEVKSVFGKVGKAETSTDPAPLSMVETTVVLRDESEWRTREHRRWYSEALPDALKPPLRWIWPEQRRITWEELIDEMDRTLQIPSYANAWLFPVRTRIDMITTGVRTPVGIKVLGQDLEEIERIGLELEKILRGVPGTRSAFFERVTGGYYLDIRPRREEAARYGLSPGDVNDVVEAAIGGTNITTTIEGRERYPVNVRYARSLRDDLPDLRRVLVATPSGAQVPLEQLATIERKTGPSMIKNEEGFKAGFLYVDVVGRDLGSYVRDAKAAVARTAVPPGYQLAWSGQYEYMERVKQRLWVVVPITLAIIFLLLHLNTGSTVKTLIILLAVPFSAIGAILFVWWLGYNMSIAVWVGLIALLGVDAETGVFMLLYLDLAYERAKAEGRMRSAYDLREAVMEGAVKRLRPKVMTVTVMFMGLVPIMWASGTGSEVMQRIAAPMIGGIFTSFLMELLVYPVVYELWKARELRREGAAPAAA